LPGQKPNSSIPQRISQHGQINLKQQKPKPLAFYRKEGFTITADTRYLGTNLPTRVMHWKYTPRDQGVSAQ